MMNARSFFFPAALVLLLAITVFPAIADTAKIPTKPLVTFIELGSVNCIPCKAMRPVMTDIETSFGGRVKVDFYDVWTKEGEPYGRKFGIRVIPTQVFLDKDGKEFYRHEGFFLASDIKALLKEHGVAP
jgi:thioredoxin 1